MDTPLHNDLVARVKHAMAKHGYKQTDVMRDSGVSNTVLCHWLRRKYKGDNARVNARLAEWVQGVEERSRWTSNHTRKFAGAPLFMDLDAVTLKTMPPENLVPISIVIEADGIRLQDAFLWNLAERRITPEWFAGALCEDERLPASFAPLIAQSIREQLANAKQDTPLSATLASTSQTATLSIAPASDSPPEDLESVGDMELDTEKPDSPPIDATATAESAASQPPAADAQSSVEAVDRATVASAATNTAPAGTVAEVKTSYDLGTPSGSDAATSAFPAPGLSSPDGKEVLLLIKLDLSLRGLRLHDQFLWDAYNPLNSPEDFARDMCCDLGLGGDWLALIAHTIRAQIQRFRSLDNARRMAPSLPSSTVPAPLPELFDGPRSVSQAIRDIDQVDKWRPHISLADP